MRVNESIRWPRLAAAVLFSLFASSASAQPVQGEPAGPGESPALTNINWTIESRDLAQPSRTVRESDSLLNGALIGAGATVASVLLVCRSMEPWDVCLNDGGMITRFALIGAGIGAGVDALIRKKTTIYEDPGGRRLDVAPLVGRRTKGVAMTLTF